MKFKAIAVTAAATALSLGLAGPALATPLTAKAVPQVTGSRLASALLPSSAFGSGFTTFNRHNSGSRLHSTLTLVKPSNASCVNFATFTYIVGYGNTAGALASFSNPNLDLSLYPNVILDGDQYVLQFGSAGAAQTFYNRAYTRYKQCSAFNEPDPADQSHVELTTQSLSSTTIDGHKAFQLVQHADVAAFSGVALYEVTAVVLAGANVYTIDDLNGTNDPVSASLLGSLISRVQALYRHH